MNERRMRRSSRIDQAVQYQLDTCAISFHMLWMVMCDSHGTIIAVNGKRDAIHNVIAAHIPLIHRAREEYERTVLATSLMEEAPQLQGKRLRVRRLVVHKEEFFLCGVTTPEKQPLIALQHAEQGIQRIMTH